MPIFLRLLTFSRLLRVAVGSLRSLTNWLLHLFIRLNCDNLFGNRGLSRIGTTAFSLGASISTLLVFIITIKEGGLKLVNNWFEHFHSFVVRF